MTSTIQTTSARVADRVDAQIRLADLKAGIVLTANAFIFAGLTAYQHQLGGLIEDPTGHFVFRLGLGSVLASILIALFCLAPRIPRTESKNHAYFRAIAEEAGCEKPDGFSVQLLESSRFDLEQELLQSVQKCAEIALKKMQLNRCAIAFDVLAVIVLAYLNC